MGNGGDRRAAAVPYVILSPPRDGARPPVKTPQAGDRTARDTASSDECTSFAPHRRHMPQLPFGLAEDTSDLCDSRRFPGTVFRCLTIGQRQNLQYGVIDVVDGVTLTHSLGSNAGFYGRQCGRRPALEHRAPKLDVGAGVIPDGDEPDIVWLKSWQECPTVVGPMIRAQPN